MGRDLSPAPDPAAAGMRTRRSRGRRVIQCRCRGLGALPPLEKGRVGVGIKFGAVIDSDPARATRDTRVAYATDTAPPAVAAFAFGKKCSGLICASAAF